MKVRQLGKTGPVSALALGGGGIGSVWGPTSRSEAVDTVRAAVASGVTLLDLAPAYGSAEEVVGAAFDGAVPDDVRIVTKCRLGNPPAHEVDAILRQSLEGSLQRLRSKRVDVMMLHGTIVAGVDGDGSTLSRTGVTSLHTYRTCVVPAMLRLVGDGLIDHWGISAIELPARFLEAAPLPDVAECVANVMGRPGGTIPYDPAVAMTDTLAALSGAGIGTLGVRAVMAGALVDLPDRPLTDIEAADYQQAASFRALARELGSSAGALAHRYALSVLGVDTVVMGVKNREELDDCLMAEAAGVLPPSLMERIGAAVATPTD